MPVSLCKEKGRQILSAIDRCIPSDYETSLQVDWDKDLDWNDLYLITEGVREFEVLLNAELSNLDVYAVSSKGIYSIPQLIEHVDHTFDEDVRAILPENAKHDICQAGRCLAFDLPTASGFHIARAVESVLLGYLEELCPDAVTALNPSQRNLGSYIELAKGNKGEEKICAVLDQFRKLDRNPLIHPDAVLTMGQALVLFGTSQSIILSLATEMQKPRAGA